MRVLLIALGIVGTIPLLAAAQYHEVQQPTRSVIKPVGFHHHFKKSDCGCQEPVPTCTTCAPTCCTPVPPPTVGRCCPKPCLLERLHRGLRSLDCLLPCNLGCKSINCNSTCNSCTASCATKPACGSCCTKSRAHFFAFCKPKCSFGCGASVGCSTPCQVGCCDSVPMHMHPPVPPVDDGNPFQDDLRPMDPNTPPPGQNTYKPYWKKGTATARVTTPLPQPTPAKLDPYAVAPPVRIKAQPAPAPSKVASRLPKVVAPEYAAVKVAIAQEVETVSLVIADDEPPAPPAGLPLIATPRIASPKIATQRYDSSIPVNPLR